MQSPLPPLSDTLQAASSFVSVQNKTRESEQCRVLKQSVKVLIGLLWSLHSLGELTNRENPRCPSQGRAEKMTATQAWPERLLSSVAGKNWASKLSPTWEYRRDDVSEVWSHTQITAHAGACGMSGHFSFTEYFLRLVGTDPSNLKRLKRQNQLCSLNRFEAGQMKKWKSIE